tara:strand:+ start:179 stop:355 length:177 start_codon:yes stop_codon:yes gene_type:complete
MGTRMNTVLLELIEDLQRKYCNLDLMYCTFQEMEDELDQDDWELLCYVMKYGKKPTIH